MKPLLFLFIVSLLVSSHTFAQFRLPTNELGQVQYQEIVRLADGKQTARQIMAQARSWAETHFAENTATEIQPDPENNILFIRSTSLLSGHLVRYTLTIEAKYGRYRATITDLVAENGTVNAPIQPTVTTVGELERASGSKTPNKKLIQQTVQQQTELYRQLNKTCRDMLASLRQAMNELR